MPDSKTTLCTCAKENTSTEILLTPHCDCPRDKRGNKLHHANCLLYKNATFVYPEDTCECESSEDAGGTQRSSERHVCVCGSGEAIKGDAEHSCVCDLPKDVQKVHKHICECQFPKGIKKNLAEWRSKRENEMGAMPTVLEASHPLMQRFQNSLREFLLKENAKAEEEILQLKNELKLNKKAYERDLEGIYRNDQDTNAQRMLIEEYETTLAQRTAERHGAEIRAKEFLEKQKLARETQDQVMIAEREARDELEVLTNLCKQLEQWRKETESDLTVGHKMSDKMRSEKQQLAVEKRELDIMIYGLSEEVWKLESKLEMFKKQYEIKCVEMEKVNDKITVYAAELEDLDLDKRRLVSLWNSVLVNISRRDKVFDSVREDYRELQENFSTLVINLNVTKNISVEEMKKGKEIAMNKDKLLYDYDKAKNLYDREDHRRITNETQLGELTESIEMTARDTELIKMENTKLRSMMTGLVRELDRKIIEKLNLDSEILANLEECFLNDKAVEAMAKGIRDMREMTRKQEIALMTMESKHAKLMLDIELQRILQDSQQEVLKKTLALVTEREIEMKELQDNYDKRSNLIMRKRRALDFMIDKHAKLKDRFDSKTPQELQIENLENEIKRVRERTTHLQYDWLRLQGHVIRLANQFQKTATEVNLCKKQLQICEQKSAIISWDREKVIQEKMAGQRILQGLQGRLAVLETTRKDALEKNDNAHKYNLAYSHEYAANLKSAEATIIEVEEDIEAMEKEKSNLTQELDRAQRESLIWQRKGILAVELKKSMKEAKSAAGEIGQMRIEIHRMEVRKEQLRCMGEKLSEDMAQYIGRRESALEKTRAAAAVEKSHGPSKVSQSVYHHKLRSARSDVARVTKEKTDVEATLKNLREELERLDREIADAKTKIYHIEENVATLMRECIQADRNKQWLLERSVRSQRLGSELKVVIKRQSLAMKKPNSVILSEYGTACALNDRLKYIQQCLRKEYPHFGDKLAIIENTLNIESVEGEPRLIDDAPSVCGSIEEEKENVPKKPFCGNCPS